jgi:hypothetical protein
VWGWGGVDVILEMLANVNLGNDLNVLARGGRVDAIGNRGPGNQGTATINPRAIMNREAAILGVSLPSQNSLPSWWGKILFHRLQVPKIADESI